MPAGRNGGTVRNLQEARTYYETRFADEPGVSELLNANYILKPWRDLTAETRRRFMEVMQAMRQGNQPPELEGLEPAEIHQDWITQQRVEGPKPEDHIHVYDTGAAQSQGVRRYEWEDALRAADFNQLVTQRTVAVTSPDGLEFQFNATLDQEHQPNIIFRGQCHRTASVAGEIKQRKEIGRAIIEWHPTDRARLALVAKALQTALRSEETWRTNQD